MMLAFILPTIANPYYPEIAEEVERCAQSSDYQMLLCNTHYDDELGNHHLERLVSRWVDGVIIMGSSMKLETILKHYSRGLPVVLCNWQENEQPPADIPQVAADYHAAGVLAARHLLDLGHRDIAIIVDLPQQIERLAGFRSALEDAGLTLSANRIMHGDSTLESGNRATRALLDVDPRPTAIFATTDWMALGAMEAAHSCGVKVPEELSILGVDDIVVAAHVTPALTTIAISKQQLAQAAANAVLEQLWHPGVIPPAVWISPEMRLRKSLSGPLA
jgi:DNA-binding LacI/PurR family transcriptional regulator